MRPSALSTYQSLPRSVTLITATGVVCAKVAESRVVALRAAIALAVLTVACAVAFRALTRTITVCASHHRDRSQTTVIK